MKNKQYNNFIKIINAAFSDKTPALIEPDFQSLVRLSYEQSLAPIFLEGLIKYDDFRDISVPLRIMFRSVSTESIFLQTQKTAEFCRIYKQLTDAGITPLILKGLICRICFGKYENHRYSGDEDIFVEKCDFPICRSILEKNGFYIKNNINITDNVLNNIHTVNFESEKSPLKIEVHLDFLGKSSSDKKDINNYFENIKRTPYKVRYGDTELYTLEPTYHFIFLFFHYYKHFISSGAGIRHILDLIMFLDHFKDETDSEYAKKIISDYIGEKFYTDTLAVASVFGLNAESYTKRAESLCEDLMDGGTFGFNNPEKFYANTYANIKTDKKKFALFRLVFPSFETMSDIFPELFDKPWKLPVYYFIRIKKYFKNKRNPAFEKKIIKNGKSRAEFLKKYKKNNRKNKRRNGD